MDKKLYIVLCLLLLCITFSPRHHQGSAWAITSQSATTKLLSFPSTESPSATSFFFPPCCSCLFLSTVPLKDPRREEITSPGTQGAPILHRNKLRGFCFIAKEKCRHARTIRSRNGPNRLPFSFSLFSCKKRIFKKTQHFLKPEWEKREKRSYWLRRLTANMSHTYQLPCDVGGQVKLSCLFPNSMS